MSEEKKGNLKEIMEWILCIVIAIVLALVIRHYIGTPTIVQQPSMYPTLQQNQRLILNRFSRTIKEEPKRGEIVTFEAPSSSYIRASEYDANNPVAKYENEPKGFINRFVYYVLEINKTSYIKRVIGLPGEHVTINEGKVYINGEQLEESYLNSSVVTDSMGGVFCDLVVPENCVFVLGDNRAQSTDSRRFGCVPIDRLESKVWIRFWPIELFGKVD